LVLKPEHEGRRSIFTDKQARGVVLKDHPDADAMV
jgi:ribulose kinase